MTCKTIRILIYSNNYNQLATLWRWNSQNKPHKLSINNQIIKHLQNTTITKSHCSTFNDRLQRTITHPIFYHEWSEHKPATPHFVVIKIPFTNLTEIANKINIKMTFSYHFISCFLNFSLFLCFHFFIFKFQKTRNKVKTQKKITPKPPLK